MTYKLLGGFSIVLLVIALVLSVFILMGNHSKKLTYFISFTVLALMATVSFFCMIIYSEFG